MKTPLLLTSYFDEIEETNGDDECRAWLSKVYDVKLELATFVAARRGGGRAIEYVGFMKGSFNISYRFRFSDGGPDAIIRFPKPGHTATALREEKVVSEVRVIECLREKTTIPVPRILSWGRAADCPHQLGPFIIMEYVEGTLLSTVLRQPDEKDIVLSPNVDDAVLDTVYRQVADYLLQLSRLTFPRIGTVSRDGGDWTVAARPLTYNMNELATVAGYPQDRFPATPFARTSAYLRSLAQEHLVHLAVQRNIADDRDAAAARFVARHRLAQLVETHCDDDDADEGPFPLFCDDLRPSNMLVDPATLQITAVLDWEFTNAMPAQFAHDPPWWLLLSGPDLWLDRGDVDGFRRLYEPRMEQFLRALGAVEAAKAAEACVGDPKAHAEQGLASRMREAWRSGRFWFDLAVRKSFDVDTVYWAVLRDEVAEAALLAGDAGAGLDVFVDRKMEQLAAYKEECSVRFKKSDAMDAD